MLLRSKRWRRIYRSSRATEVFGQAAPAQKRDRCHSAECDKRQIPLAGQIAAANGIDDDQDLRLSNGSAAS